MLPLTWLLAVTNLAVSLVPLITICSLHQVSLVVAAGWASGGKAENQITGAGYRICSIYFTSHYRISEIRDRALVSHILFLNGLEYLFMKMTIKVSSSI